MSFRISDECVACGLCALACDSEAIVEYWHRYGIRIDLCEECRRCVEVCPVDCIVPAAADDSAAPVQPPAKSKSA
ncbi:MAG: 4Fe-4S binding protein [Candidatus Sumerlaeota bacterium]|nr:4Fe-4S binding protein [Candidatus Sumerlaeota bacterium]